MAEFDGFRRLRVPPPLADLPVGLTGWRPPLVRPSPPPCGWSMGFMAVPRTCGRRPNQRLRPAFPSTTFMWSALPNWPIVARQLAGIRRISPLGSVICAHSPSRATNVAVDSGRSAQFAPLAGLQLYIMNRHPGGMFLNGSALPTVGGRIRAAHALVAVLQPFRSQDEPLLAIRVMQEGNPGPAVGIVLGRVHRGRDAIFVTAEVDQPQCSLVAAATMTGGDDALVVAAALASWSWSGP